MYTVDRVAYGDPADLLNSGLDPFVAPKIEWVDVAAPDDRIVIYRVGAELGFHGNPLKVVGIAAGYDRPHSAYFFNETALGEWVGYLK